MKTAALSFVCAILFAALWVRLAPFDVARWHVPPKSAENRDGRGSAMRVVPGGGMQAMMAIDAVALATPRTRVLAGSPSEGRVSYITRTRIWGFPDVTTVSLVGQDVVLYGRLRFGKSDLGVNRSRLERWVSEAAAARQARGKAAS